MKATVTLREGISYTWKGYKFISGEPHQVTNPSDIEELKNNALLWVVVDDDIPAAAKELKKGKPPAPREDDVSPTDADILIDAVADFDPQEAVDTAVEPSASAESKKHNAKRGK